MDDKITCVKTGNGLYTNAQMVQNVINTLCTISVSGKDNLDRLLGCIVALEAVHKVLKEKEGNVETILAEARDDNQNV